MSELNQHDRKFLMGLALFGGSVKFDNFDSVMSESRQVQLRELELAGYIHCEYLTEEGCWKAHLEDFAWDLFTEDELDAILNRMNLQEVGE